MNKCVPHPRTPQKTKNIAYFYILDFAFQRKREIKRYRFACFRVEGALFPLLGTVAPQILFVIIIFHHVRTGANKKSRTPRKECGFKCVRVLVVRSDR
jgi:hypothetical protein